jgi:lipopolysaccharide/colanic/teichoic acid biosynthesis glycosyltransferase
MENGAVHTSFYIRYGKPALDRLIGLTLALVTLPALLVLLAVSWAEFGWSPLEGEPRLGKGRTFILYRINTSNRSGTDLRGRPLRVSTFLRRTSLNELPQLWNVVLGHMSLVGPRPIDPRSIAELPAGVGFRHETRPGLTGPWQVDARGDGRNVADRTAMDLEYVRHISLGTDLSLLLRTVPALIRRREAA